MLANRDFSKPNKEYFKKNKFVILILALVIIAGVVCALALGFNGNFEMKGCYEFNVSITETNSKQISKYEANIETILNSHNAKFDKVSIEGEGDRLTLVVRYLKSVKSEEQSKINAEIASKLGISEEEISSHSFVSKVVRGRDFLFTAVAILLIVVVATIFACFRYDIASAISMLLTCLLGNLLFLSISSILRLTIGLSYFAMIVILNLLIIYCSFKIFERIRETSWLQSKEYAAALDDALRSTKVEVLFVSIATMVVGLLFALLAPVGIKYVSINILFVSTTLIWAVWYILPFLWSTMITRANIRRFRVKTQKTQKDED